MSLRMHRPSRDLLRHLADNLWTALAMVLIAAGLLMMLTPGPELIGDPMEGLTLYQSNCTDCHASDGAGGVKIGNAISADVRWSTLGPVFQHSDSLVRQALLSGIADDGDQLGAEMPRFRGHLIDSEIDNVVAYLQTLSGPRSQ